MWSKIMIILKPYIKIVHAKQEHKILWQRASLLSEKEHKAGSAEIILQVK